MRPLDIPCPTCAAPAGVPCRLRSALVRSPGVPRREPHRARLDATAPIIVPIRIDPVLHAAIARAALQLGEPVSTYIRRAAKDRALSQLAERNLGGIGGGPTL